MDSSIRRARDDDAVELAALGARTFSDAFGHSYPARDLAAFLAENHTPDHVRAHLADPETAIWVAEQEGRLIGYVQVGPSHLPHDDIRPEDGELQRIYVLRDAQNSGAGRAMLALALDWLEAQGRKRVWLGVWSENTAAQRLYARYGFEKVGEYEFAVGDQRDHEFIFRRG